MINLKNEKALSLVTGQTVEYTLRIKDYLPYPDKEVEEAVRILANWMGMKSTRPKILWLGKNEKKEFEAPKKIDVTELARRAARYYEGFKAVENRLYSVNNDVSNEWFGYYTAEDQKAPEELRKLIKDAEIGWGRRRLDDLINTSGVIRGKFKRVVGSRDKEYQRNWTIPNQYYATSADKIRNLGRFVRAFLLGEHFVDKRKGDHKLLEACKKIYISLYSILPHNGHLILVERPRLYSNERGLHRDGGYAIEFPKLKVGVYSRNGVRVNRELALTEADKLSADIITHTTNAEIRREAVDKIGIDRVLKELACEILDQTEDGRYQLVNLDLGDTEPWSSTKRMRPFLKMLNPSTGDWHVEGVAPHIRTVPAALAWRNGVNEGDEPQELTLEIESNGTVLATR